MNRIKYSLAPMVENDDHKALVDGLTILTKMSLTKRAAETVLAKKYSVSTENYDQLNEDIKAKLLKFAAKEAGIADKVDVTSKAGLIRAFKNDTFEWNFFAVQTEVLGTLMADVEVGQAMGFVNMSTVGLGDSKTFYIGSKALYEVEDAAYGNRVTRPRKQFKQPVTITPSAKEASVQFDVIQLLTNGYDFGAEMAKIIISIRADQYDRALNVLFTTTPLSGTPFYKATFNSTNYTTLAEVVGAVNGTGVTAYGTRTAYRTASSGITAGFAVQDELVKNSFISDLHGVPSQILEQAVNTQDANFTFKVPNDKILVMGNTGEKPVKIVQEDYFEVERNDGSDGNVATLSYKYIFSYGIGLATSAPYGIQAV